MNGSNTPVGGARTHSHIPKPLHASSLKGLNHTPAEIFSKTPLKTVNGETRWQDMYEATEKKRKILVTQTQKGAREYADLERKHHKVTSDHVTLQKQLTEKESKLAELRKVSEAMIREYDQLRNKYELETGALHEAMKSATQWYKQNRVLKRQSAIIVQKMMSVAPGSILDIDMLDGGDTSETEDRELDDLRRSVKALSDEVGRLQAELSSARLEEFEAQEQLVSLSAEVEAERSARLKAESELADLRAMRDNMDTVTHLVANEMVALRNQCQQDQQVAQAMKKQAHQAQKERNVLAHQSALLMSEVMSDERQIKLLHEVESLKSALEDEQRQHSEQIRQLQDKLDEQESASQLELMEEKLKLAESELQCALHRAERAELQTAELSSTVSRLENEQVTKINQPPQILPPPPPPPPPPLPPSGSLQHMPNAVVDMAKMLGLPRKTAPTAVPQGGAIDDIINQIKGGRFLLKAPEKQKEKENKPVPPAVQEMLNILGTMKRWPKQQAAPADVAL